MTYSISWQLRDIIKWTLHHICISINNYNFIQRHLTHFLKKEEWRDDFKVYQEWIDSNKHSVSEEDIVRIKTELSQLDEKTYSWLLFSRPMMMMMMMMMMMNWWIWKMWKWKKKTAFQFSSRQDTCSVPTSINDECTPTRKGIGALKEKMQGDNRLVNSCSALHKDKLQVTRVI